MKLTPIERRVLAYLDQHGPSHRSRVVCDLAHPDSRAGRGIVNGSNGAAPLIMGKWCARLRMLRLVVVETDNGFYRRHDITHAGRTALRDAP